MKKIYLLILLFSSQLTQAQLKDCSLCATQTYTAEDIAQNSLGEIKILRNEIFARHGYRFKNARLEEYFSNFYWYDAKTDSASGINLNSVEEANINLFRNREAVIKSEREAIIAALTEVKRAINNHDDELIKLYFNDNVEEAYYSVYVETLDKIFDKIDLNDVNWHHHLGAYSVVVDNGFQVESFSVRIEQRKQIEITHTISSHSELIDKPFTYPSMYYSEKEHAIQFSFIYAEGTIELKDVFEAG